MQEYNSLKPASQARVAGCIRRQIKDEENCVARYCIIGTDDGFLIGSGKIEDRVLFNSELNGDDNDNKVDQLRSTRMQSSVRAVAVEAGLMEYIVR